MSARKAAYFWLLLCLSLQFVAIVVKAETQRQHHPYTAADVAVHSDVDYESNGVSPYHRSSYQQGNTRGRQFEGNDASYQQNNRRRPLRKQQQALQKKARGQMGSNETQMGRNMCQIWVPTEVVDKYPYPQTVQVDKSNELQKIQICCTGYVPMRWRASTFCRPVCENCRNGRCVAPNECECFDNFVANDSGDCVFACPLGCLNGRCFLDGTCQCDPGYKLDETRKFCRPICSNGCGMNPRHNCTEPEVCGCAKGYQLTDNGCQPICEPDCGEGGECRDPNECDCAAGYELKDGVCQRECYQKCDNGICYSSNRCICNPGYAYHERSTQCVPN